jgi:hypothetical protein
LQILLERNKSVKIGIPLHPLRLRETLAFLSCAL